MSDMLNHREKKGPRLNSAIELYQNLKPHH